MARLSKDELRRAASRAMASLGPASIAELSARVEARLAELKEYRTARTIACYVATKGEVQTESIIKGAMGRGAKVIVPVVLDGSRLLFSELKDYDDELAPSTFGILEPKPEFFRPVPLERADLVLVPVVAWDEKGRRLGHGRGYFDRALSGPLEGEKMGLALEAQRVEEIPAEAHDVPLDAIVTDRRVLRFSGDR